MILRENTASYNIKRVIGVITEPDFQSAVRIQRWEGNLQPTPASRDEISGGNFINKGERLKRTYSQKSEQNLTKLFFLGVLGKMGGSEPKSAVPEVTR